MIELRVLFIHGGGYGVGRDLEKQPFALYIKERFRHSHTDRMLDTTDFERNVIQQAHAIRKFRPDVVVAKSQGGPLTLKLLQRGFWKGPSVLCCAAVVPGIDSFEMPSDVPFLIVNGTKDVAVPVHIGERLVKEHKARGGTAELVLVPDDHGLLSLLDDSQHPNVSTLVTQVLDTAVGLLTKGGQVWAMRKETRGFDPRQSVPDTPLPPLRPPRAPRPAVRRVHKTKEKRCVIL